MIGALYSVSTTDIWRGAGKVGCRKAMMNGGRLSRVQCSSGDGWEASLMEKVVPGIKLLRPQRCESRCSGRSLPTFDDKSPQRSCNSTGVLLRVILTGMKLLPKAQRTARIWGFDSSRLVAGPMVSTLLGQMVAKVSTVLYQSDEESNRLKVNVIMNRSVRRKT